MQRIFIKKMFSVYGVKCLWHKSVHNWVEEFPQGRSKVADDARQGSPADIATEAKISMLRISTHW
jgi:hypothetical protein